MKQLLTADLELIGAVDNLGRPALHFALEYGHEEVVVILVESVTPENVSHAKAMFYHAIKSDCVSIASQLLSRSPGLIDVARFADGKSALQLAAAYGRRAIVNQVFALRPHLAEVGGNYSMSVLHFAVENGYDTVVAQLLADRPELIDAVGTKGRSVLHLAAERGDQNIVSQLLAAKPALASRKDSFGKIALHRAAQWGHDKVVAQLLAHSPELIDVEDRQGRNALRLAVVPRVGHHESHPEIAVMLLAHGSAADVEIPRYAVRNDLSGEVARSLLIHQPKLTRSVDHKHKGTFLHFVFDRRRDNSFCSEELMLKVWEMNPEALHALDKGKETPFDRAVWSDNKFAITLALPKVSFDEVGSAFAKCKRACPRARLAEFVGALEPLNKDLVELVWGYLGAKKKRTANKRARSLSKE